MVESASARSIVRVIIGVLAFAAVLSGVFLLMSLLVSGPPRDSASSTSLEWKASSLPPGLGITHSFELGAWQFAVVRRGSVSEPQGLIEFMAAPNDRSMCSIVGFGDRAGSPEQLDALKGIVGAAMGCRQLRFVGVVRRTIGSSEVTFDECCAMGGDVRSLTADLGPVSGRRVVVHFAAADAKFEMAFIDAVVAAITEFD